VLDGYRRHQISAGQLLGLLADAENSRRMNSVEAPGRQVPADR
jgi:hypothetical protein